MRTRRHLPRPRAALAAAAAGITALAASPFAAATPLSAAAAPPPPTSVSVPGSFGGEAGCGGDWDPTCTQLQMTPRASDGIWSVTLRLPAGSWEYKAALDGSFDENYGKGAVEGGANIAVTVPDGGASVTFLYDPTTHWVTDSVQTTVVTAAGDFQSELGCPSDWSPDCLRSWLEDPDGDGTATFTTTAIPAGTWAVKAAVGQSWDVDYVQGGAPGGANIPFTVAADGDTTAFSYDSATHVLSVLTGPAATVDVRTPRAYWLTRHWIAWDLGADAADRTYALASSPTGGLGVDDTGVTGGSTIPLSYRASGLPADLVAKYPAQAGLGALYVPSSAMGRVKELLRGQLAVVASKDGTVVDGSGLQVPGVLDDMFSGAAKRTLGPTWKGGAPSLALWAPTARAVSVQVYADGSGGTPVVTRPLHRDGNGVWAVRGDASWKNRYYLYDVEVFVPETGRVEHNLVTDPYSLGLSTNSERSLFVDLADRSLQPDGWGHLTAPALAAPEDQSITELHLRDFSISDPTVPAGDRGTYEAFTDTSSDAVQHLVRLRRAGLTTVHLLPLADMATVDERRSTWLQPECDLPSLPPASGQQQACVTAVAGQDGYNWGYDPLHYTVPEGSYATDPVGSARTRQFRDMVAALNRQGLRVVMDVVYNHTTDSGENGRNDLDRIVPGYYHRLDANGAVETSTCCSNTATEHTMMGKLMVDSVLTWAEEYEVDGFRFDLMGHQPRALMVQLRQRLDALTPARDGIDGRSVYLYGEGWDFGEVANDALFVNATQANTAGTGIGTFNDRLRDAVRGGGPFDTDPRAQGFGSGPFTEPNGEPVNGDADTQKAQLLHDEDLVKVALTGDLEDYVLTDATGARVKGSQVDYNGAPAGYTHDPQEAINYVDAHDNQTLYDALTLKLPQSTSMADRIRMQDLSLAATALSQGVSFWQAGTEMLRSKSFDSNSYDSGDWFNLFDPDYRSNGFARGLPPAASNSTQWSYEAPLLADPALDPTPADIVHARSLSETLLQLRSSTPLFHLGTAAAVERKVSFPDSGPGSTPGVITMRIDDTVGADADPALRGVVVVFNASPSAVTQVVPGTRGARYTLSTPQVHGTDAVVRESRFDGGTGSFTVPGRTVAVFVAPQGG